MASRLTDILRNILGTRSEGGDADTAPAAGATEYNGFLIHPAPRRQGSLWLTAGRITRQYPDGVREHTFIRADTYADRDEAVAFCIRKARQIIDEQGERIFDSREGRTPAP
ncbi:MAG: transcriptional regulator [Rhodospirillaceae bacterium]|nr:transcriptional regulator [Rhodospirillaceae bacterium]